MTGASDSEPMPRCALCPKLLHRCPVPPDGPRPCRLLFLGEAPHIDEDKNQVPFFGKTGMELNNVYLPILGIPRSEVCVFNARACSAPDYSNPTPEQALACSSVHLSPLLAEARPEIIVAMGAVACALFGNFNLMRDHGIPVIGRWGGWTGIVWPTLHPSSGIHSTSFMIPLMEDFHNLKKFLGRL